MKKGRKDWVKGCPSPNPTGNTGGGHIGRRKRSVAEKMVIWNLREAARRHCEEALEVVASSLKSKSEKVRLLAAQIMLDRGYGKAREMVDVNVSHAFAEVPQVMELSQWLETRGQPQLLPPMADDDDPKTINDPDKKLN